MSWLSPVWTELTPAEDSHGRSIAIWRLDGKCEVPLEPLWVSKAVHQSGVNCMDVQSGESEYFLLILLLQFPAVSDTPVVLADGAFYLVSGGDDNSIVFQHLRFTSDGDQVDLISHAAVAAAHSSSVKGELCCTREGATGPSSDEYRANL